jgi:calcineurin-like phosphoesterase family protein
MIFFTADTHFSHINIIKYCYRPFKDYIEHDETLIENWNKQVSRTDQVYHLGDFAYGSHDNVRRIRAKLKGKIHLILGNHDLKNRIQNLPGLFTSINQLKTICINKQHIVLCHYAMRIWDKSHFNSWHLFGHSHGRSPGQGKSFDCGVDTNNFKLYSMDDIVGRMKNCSDNINLLRGEK